MADAMPATKLVAHGFVSFHVSDEPWIARAGQCAKSVQRLNQVPSTPQPVLNMQAALLCGDIGQPSITGAS